MGEEGIELGPSREAFIFSCSSGNTKIQFLWRCLGPCDLMPALALCIFKALYHQLAVVSSQKPPGSCAGTSGTMQSLSPSQMTQAPQGYFCKAGRVSVIPSDRWEKWEEVQWQDSPRAFLLTCAVNAWVTQPRAPASQLKLPLVLFAANHWQKHQCINSGSSQGSAYPCIPFLMKNFSGNWQKGYAKETGTEHLPARMPWKRSDAFPSPSPLIMIKALNHALGLQSLHCVGLFELKKRNALMILIRTSL